MAALDCADPSMQVDKRNETLSPLQALALLNNGFMLTMAEALRRAGRSGPADPAAGRRRVPAGARPRRRRAEEREALAAYATAARAGERLPGDPELERVRVRGLKPMTDTTVTRLRRAHALGATFLWHVRRRPRAASPWPRCSAATACSPPAAPAAVAGRAADGGLHHAPRRGGSCSSSWPAAASHIDLFDYKPELVKRHGQPSDFGEHVEAFQNGLGPWLRPVWDFKPYGQCGKMLGEVVAAARRTSSTTSRSSTTWSARPASTARGRCSKLTSRLAVC